jgi:hypothetical protein
VGVGLGTWSTAWIAIPPRVGLYEGHLDPETLDAVYRLHPAGEPRGTQTWVLDGCDRVGDRVATKWLFDTSLAWTDRLSDDLVVYALAHKGTTDGIRDQLHDPNVTVVELVVHRACDRAALEQLEGDPKVRVIRVP